MTFKSIAAKEMETLKNDTLNTLKELCQKCMLLKGEVPEGTYIYSVMSSDINGKQTSFLAVSKYSKFRWAILTPEGIDEDESSIIKHFLDSKVPDGAEIFVFTGRDLIYLDMHRCERRLSMFFQSL